MLIGVIADDFTGAGDIANTLARGGLATAQYLGLPARPAEPEVEAGVVALKSRSIPAAEAVAQSLAALGWLRAQGCRQIVFKYCSTFDSTPEGNIGPVARALAEALGVGAGVVVCPAFPGAGRTLYQGHLFVGDRLLSESGMERHPLTPMTDPDIRRWLGRQVGEPVGLVPLDIVRAGAAAIRAALEAGPRLVVVDAVSEDDLRLLGAALEGAPLVTGGSGIALGLGANFIARGLARGRAGEGFRGRPGAEAILAGSCSGATRGQIDYHARAHPAMPIPVDAVMAGEIGAGEVLGFLARHAGEAPLAYSSATPEEVRAAQRRHGRERVSDALDRLFAETARGFLAQGGRRLVVAGGETSGAVARALGFEALTIGPEIDPGVPVLLSPDAEAALALKSGNFGRENFFERALDVLERGRA